MEDLLRGPALLEQLLAVPFADRDAWVDARLGFDAPPPDVPLPRGAVPYLPSGVDAIVAMVREVPVRPDDTLVDLGSGAGRVPILVHLLTGARAHGIEIQDHLVQIARTRAEQLRLPGVTFVTANVLDAELDGSLFFLYAPFNGELLNAVVRRLELVARRRPITICTVDLELHDQPWLRARATSCASLTVYESAHGEL